MVDFFDIFPKSISDAWVLVQSLVPRKSETKCALSGRRGARREAHGWGRGWGRKMEGSGREDGGERDGRRMGGDRAGEGRWRGARQEAHGNRIVFFLSQRYFYLGSTPV